MEALFIRAIPREPILQRKLFSRTTIVIMCSSVQSLIYYFKEKKIMTNKW